MSEAEKSLRVEIEFWKSTINEMVDHFIPGLEEALNLQEKARKEEWKTTEGKKYLWELIMALRVVMRAPPPEPEMPIIVDDCKCTPVIRRPYIHDDTYWCSNCQKKISK